MNMGKAAKQARNREIKRKQREERIKVRVEYAKGQITAICRGEITRVKCNGIEIPLHLAVDAYKKYIKENERVY